MESTQVVGYSERLSDEELAKILAEKRGEVSTSEVIYTKGVPISVVEPSAGLLEAKIRIQNRKAEYKDYINTLRFKRNNASRRRRALGQEIKRIVQARKILLDQFQGEASKMYPELQMQEAYKVLSDLSPGHPLLHLWSKYSAKIAEQDLSIAQNFSEYRQELTNEVVAETEESKVMTDYQTLVAETDEAAEELQILPTEVEIIDPVSYAEDVAMFSDIANLDIISDEARAMIEMDLAYEDELLNAESTDSKLLTMTAQRSVATSDELPQERKIPKAVIYGGLAAAIYFLLG